MRIDVQEREPEGPDSVPRAESTPDNSSTTRRPARTPVRGAAIPRIEEPGPQPWYARSHREARTSASPPHGRRHVRMFDGVVVAGETRSQWSVGREPEPGAGRLSASPPNRAATPLSPVDRRATHSRAAQRPSQRRGCPRARLKRVAGQRRRFRWSGLSQEGARGVV
jgi:hypothetical protein